MQNKIEKFWSIGQKFIGLSICFGAVLILLYCSDIGFYPKGIEIGDGLMFIWLALSFGFRLVVVVSIFTMVGAVSYSSIAKLISFFTFPKRLPSIKFKENVFFVFIVSVISLILYFLILSSSDYTVLDKLYIVIGILASGMFYCLLFHRDESNLWQDEDSEYEDIFESKSRKKMYLVYLLAVFFIVYVLLISFKGLGSRILHNSFSYMAIKQKSVSIFLDKNSYEIINNYISKYNLEKEIIPVSDEKFRVDNVNVLFQGIGDNIFIELAVDNKNIKLSLPSSSTFIVKSNMKCSSPLILKVIEKELRRDFEKYGMVFYKDDGTIVFSNHYGLFKVGKSNINQSFKSVLNMTMPKLFKILSENKGLVKSVEVVGYASPKWEDSDGFFEAYYNNHELANKRAMNFFEYLYKSKKISEFMIPMNEKFVIKSNSSNNRKDSQNRIVGIKVIPYQNCNEND